MPISSQLWAQLSSHVDAWTQRVGGVYEPHLKSPFSPRNSLVSASPYPEKMAEPRGRCRLFTTPQGCRFGNRCKFSHDRSSTSSTTRTSNASSRSTQPLDGARSPTPNRPPSSAPRQVCSVFWESGKCNRSFDCRFKHERKPNASAGAQPTPVPEEDPDFFSLEGMVSSSGAASEQLHQLNPHEAHNHIKFFLRDNYTFENASKVQGFVRILASIGDRNKSWNSDNAQGFLDFLVKGDGLIRLGEVLRYQPVSHRIGNGTNTLSFQRGYFPVFQFMASNLVVKSTWHKNINHLYTVLKDNYETIHDILRQCIGGMIEQRSWKDPTPRLTSVLQNSLDGVVVFKTLTTVLLQYFNRFKDAIRNHPQIVTLVEDIVQWFEVWAADVSSNSSRFADGIATAESSVRRAMISQLREEVQRLLDIVQRENEHAERLKRPSGPTGITAAQRAEADIMRFTQTYDAPGELREGGPRHDNDFVHISDIRIAPTNAELLCPHPPYLPVFRSEAPHHLRENSMERHLDIQFRLLREELVAPIRSSLVAVSQDLNIIRESSRRRVRRELTKLEGVFKKNGGAYKTSGFDSLFFQIYTNVEFAQELKAQRRDLSVGLIMDSPPGNGRSDDANSRATYWKHSKRLQSGSLIALAIVTDGTLDVFLGVVSSFSDDIIESAKALKDRIQVQVTFFDPEIEFRALKRDKLTRAQSSYAFLVDNSIMFEATRPFWRGLKLLNQPRFRFLRSFTYTGPPGTGKSYIGREIIRVLTKSKIKPIVLIAYTNHALDHMLTAVLDEGITKRMVRLGSRSSDERIAEYTWTNSKKLQKLIFISLYRKPIPCSKGIEEEMTSVMESIQLPTLNVMQICQFLEIHFPEQCDVLFNPPYWIAVLSEQLWAEEEENGEWNEVGGGKKKVAVSDLPQSSQEKAKSERASDNRDETVAQGTSKVEEFFSNIGFLSELPPIPSSNRDVSHLLTSDAIWSMSLPERIKLQKTIQGLRKKYKDACDEYNEIRDESSDLIGCTTTGAAKLTSLIESKRQDKSGSPYFNFAGSTGKVLHAPVCQKPHICLISASFDLHWRSPAITTNPRTFALSMENARGKELFRLTNLLWSASQGAYFICTANIRLINSRTILYPNLEDNPLVLEYPPVQGVPKDVYFLNHIHPEGGAEDSVSKFNMFEVEMIRDLVLYFLRQGTYSGEGDIAVLCAYLGQVQKVRQALRDLKIAVAVLVAKHIRLGTVDIYQGQEAKIVIVSLVRNTGNYETASASIGFLKSSNRINVALSRAKHGMYILGNASNLRKNKTWSTILDEMELGGQIGTGIPIKVDVYFHAGFSFLVGIYVLRFVTLFWTTIRVRAVICLAVEHLVRVVILVHASVPMIAGIASFQCLMLHSHVDMWRRTFHVGRLQMPKQVTKRLSRCEHSKKMPCHKDPATVACTEACGAVLTQRSLERFYLLNAFNMVIIHASACCIANTSVDLIVILRTTRVIVLARTAVDSNALTKNAISIVPPPVRHVWNLAHGFVHIIIVQLHADPYALDFHATSHAEDFFHATIHVPPSAESHVNCKGRRLEEVDLESLDVSDRLITLECGHIFTVETLDGHCHMSDFYESMTWIANTRGAHVKAFEGAYSTLYRLELDAVIVEGTLSAGESPEEFAIQSARLRIGQSPPNADTKYQIEAYFRAIELRFKLAQIAEARIEGIPSAVISTGDGKKHRKQWFSFVNFLFESCVSDSGKAFKMATKSSAWRRVARCVVYRIRSDFERFRFRVLSNVMDLLTTDPNYKMIRDQLSKNVKEKINAITLRLEEFQREYIRAGLRQTRTIVEELDKLEEYVRKGGRYQPVTREEMMDIVHALDFATTGHFYTCPNGHPYTIGECGGAMQTSVCPECGESVGGSNHALLSTNRRATEFETLLQATF
ncbi:hypothetical protein BDQ17DRAFT_1428824 [Cyathus striatus]|nr:hypothetical protein BDQ17DRAFT_1428824 [Cyathus striatus]